MQLVHVGNQPFIDPPAPPGVGDLPLSLDAHDGDQIPAPVKQVEIPFVHKGAVGKDGEQDALPPSGGLDDIPPEHGLAPCQKNKADAQLVRLVKDPGPVLPSKLADRLRVHRGVIAPGIASHTVQIALAGDAGDEKGGMCSPRSSAALRFLEAARLAAANFAINTLSLGSFKVAFTASDTTRSTPWVI